jgi:hypothetical protein
MGIKPMKIDEELRQETQRWLERIKREIEKCEIQDKNKIDFLQNVRAYISDSEHFLKEEKLVLAFEAVIWAWAWFDIGLRQGWWKVKK